MKKNDEGFTLIELLIVIVILGILATVVVFAVGGITDRGQDSACAADEATVAVALEAYFAKNSTYPTGASAAARETALVTAGFLRSTSAYWDVSNTLGGIVPIAPCT